MQAQVSRAANISGKMTAPKKYFSSLRGFRVQSSEFRVQSSKFRVSGFSLSGLIYFRIGFITTFCLQYQSILFYFALLAKIADYRQNEHKIRK